MVLRAEAGLRQGQLALAFNVDLVHPVDHDLGDGGIVQQALEGAEAQDVVGNILDQPGAFLGRQRNLFGVDDPRQLLLGRAPQLVLGGRRVVEARAHPLEKRGGRAVLHGGEDVHGLCLGHCRS
ncbi:hypothetical protein GCM10011577_13600 [Pseudarthrobacter polychromogenes]|uniref:Uncharacterized protein n=1 Tax=Pseudarthrobacter polychromogenes TaxID=1676 RepID=A0ABQ1XEF6_9MICC|nr:hypothetical protein GCM10011577_13600 [Pseudarthrobacter polychromogenes]